MRSAAGAWAAAVVVGLTGAVVAPGSIASAAAAPIGEKCTVRPGVGLPETWPQDRLDFDRAWSITRGKGVLVAVVDSGLDTRHPQLTGMSVKPGVNVLTNDDNTADCDNHGTEVTSIIAAQPIAGSRFEGVAPDATIMPIKQTDRVDQNEGSNADSLGRAIDAAVSAHAKVVNLSVSVKEPTEGLHSAVRRAAQADVVLVTAVDNFGQQGNPVTFPSAYSTEFPNVIAVAASDIHDVIAPFSESGDYVSVTAPGVAVPAAAPVRGFAKLDGTSFAAPFVTGTVALLRAAYPKMTAEQIRNRIEATADAPPADVPGPHFGFGIVNPFLALTSVRADAPADRPRAAAGPPLPARAAPSPADHHLAHVALMVALALLGVSGLAVIGAAVLRRSRPNRAAPVASGAPEIEPARR